MSNPPLAAKRASSFARARVRPSLRIADLLVLFAFCAFGLLNSSAAGADPPLELTVADGARPIWSPDRPAAYVGEPASPHRRRTEGVSTLRFVEAGWGREPATSRPASPAVVLRWRSRKPIAGFHPTRSSAPREPIAWHPIESGTPSSPPAAQDQRAADPFDDPFADRHAQADVVLAQYESAGSEDATPLELPSESPSAPSSPATSEPSLQPAGPTQPPTGPTTGPLGATPSSPEPPEGAMPLPGESAEPLAPSGQPRALEPEIPVPPLKSPAPSVGPAAPAEKSAPAAECQRIYNERDCCEEGQKCKTALRAVQENSIKNISLDITASFKPDAETLEEKRQALEDQLRLMPARVWRDREGQELASGRLTDLRNRRVVVRQSDGELATLPLAKLSDDDLCFLAAWWGVPTECTLGDQQLAMRAWQPVTFAWKASALCHKPLYFEEVQLERYGHTSGPILQPLRSGAHFFLNVAVLPYRMGINPPNECQYALGYYRPGSCAPWLVPPLPLSVRGGLFEAGAITGSVLLFP